MILDLKIREKSFGNKTLMTDVSFSIEDGEKVGLVGRNGLGKSTLLHIIAGRDTDFTGAVNIRNGKIIVETAQEHAGISGVNLVDYILSGLPEFAKLSRAMENFAKKTDPSPHDLNKYNDTLERFTALNYWDVENNVVQELANFGLANFAKSEFSSLSGGQKRLAEIVKVMNSSAHLALIDEPTNHMDFRAKNQFVEFAKTSNMAMLIVTHDRDVLKVVDKIVEIKDGHAQIFKGNYDDYLRQNASSASTSAHDYEMAQKTLENARKQVLAMQRMKERARDPGTIRQFKRRENEAREEVARLEQIKKPSIWIDSGSVADLGLKDAENYEKFKSKNIRLSGISRNDSRSSSVLVAVRDLALGYGEKILFNELNFDLREREKIELRGLNGAGKTTLIREILHTIFADDLSRNLGKIGAKHDALLRERKYEFSKNMPEVFDGTVEVSPKIRVGIYDQEIREKFLNLPLRSAIEKLYLDDGLDISDTKIRQLLSDYLFVEHDGEMLIRDLSGGQKARFQMISMLRNNPNLLVLDEPTNHLDLPSIEELETALAKFDGAVIFVSHDSYFREKIGGAVIEIGAQK